MSPDGRNGVCKGPEVGGERALLRQNGWNSVGRKAGVRYVAGEGMVGHAWKPVQWCRAGW